MPWGFCPASKSCRYWFQSLDEYTQRNLFEILLNQPEIGLYLSFSGWFWIQTDIRLDPNQLENGKYNLTSVWFNKISKIFLCVYKFIISLTVVQKFAIWRNTTHWWPRIAYTTHWWPRIAYRCISLSVQKIPFVHQKLKIHKMYDRKFLLSTKKKTKISFC